MTNETRSIIFSRYLGQYVICQEFTIPVKLEGVYLNSTPVLFDVVKDHPIENLSILLKPLSSISDLHASLLHKNKALKIKYKRAEEFLKEMELFGFMPDEAMDILRHLGYATSQTVVEDCTPITYTIDELVKLGIFTIR